MHTAISMARYEVSGTLPADLLWPFDCQRRCGDMVPVMRGPAVAEEMTRNLREPFKSAIREWWRP